MSRWNLVGKNVVVTGGTKGIGAATVNECCQLGATVVTCSRKADELAACQEEWKKKGFNVHTCVADLSKTDGIQALLEFTNQIFPDKVDCLVNNVGSNIRKRAIEYSQEEYALIMNTNLTSCFELCKQMYPKLKLSTRGSVVNIGSVAGGCNSAMRSGVVYAMTKAAMTQMSYNLSVEWAADNIRVNVVSPWYIETPLTAPVLSDPVIKQAVLDRTPMKRTGLTEEVSGVVAFLCMDASSYVSGQVIATDGAFLRNGFF